MQDFRALASHIKFTCPFFLDEHCTSTCPFVVLVSFENLRNEYNKNIILVICNYYRINITLI